MKVLEALEDFPSEFILLDGPKGKYEAEMERHLIGMRLILRLH